MKNITNNAINSVLVLRVINLTLSGLFVWMSVVFDWYTWVQVSLIMGLSWTVLVHLATSYIEAFKPKMWSRHVTTVDNLQSIIKDGFNGETNERSMSTGDIGGQRGQDWISTSGYPDGAWKAMVQYGNADSALAYIYLYAPIHKSEALYSVSYTYFTDIKHSPFRAIEYSITRELANQAIKNGEYSTTRPADYFSINHAIAWLASNAVHLSMAQMFNK